MPKRPARSVLESVTSRVPKGPFGLAGKGTLIGGVGYFTVSTINGINPIDGLDVGFEIESHNVSRTNGVETHTFVIHSASKDVARFTAKFKSTPTILNKVPDEVSIESVEQIAERRAFSVWEVVTKVETAERLDTE